MRSSIRFCSKVLTASAARASWRIVTGEVFMKSTTRRLPMLLSAWNVRAKSPWVKTPRRVWPSWSVMIAEPVRAALMAAIASVTLAEIMTLAI